MVLLNIFLARSITDVGTTLFDGYRTVGFPVKCGSAGGWMFGSKVEHISTPVSFDGVTLMTQVNHGSCS